MTTTRQDKALPARQRPPRVGGETGAVIVVAVVFTMVFLIVGLGLYFLVVSQTRATDTERKEVKAFNVAEAGIDAGMLALKLGWPSEEDDQVVVDTGLLKSRLQQDPSATGLWDPHDPSQFIKVFIYDNVDASGSTSSVPNPDPNTWVRWDSNADGMMFVDSTANVDNDRHRILVLAEQHYWRLSFPLDMALCAGNVDQKGAKELGLAIEDGASAVYYIEDPAGWDEVTWDDDYTFTQDGDPGLFSKILNDSMMNALRGIAQEQGQYYTSAAAARAALVSGQANGKVVYIDIDSGSSVEIAGNTQIGTVDLPVVVVIDVRDAPGVDVIGWDMRGNADFYGILVTLGDAELRGTCSNHGAVYCEGTLTSRGQGKYEEIYYNETVIRNVNRIYTLSVNIVPNTWEEYSVPAN